MTLEAVGIGRRANGRWLLRDISLTLAGGKRLALVGPTGSGKTLLPRCLALLDPLDTGEVRWRGARVTGQAIPMFRSQVVYLHQRPALMEGTVEDVLRQPFRLRAHRHRHFERGLISVVLQLRMEKQLLIASLRTIVQLALVGLVLEWVFQLDRWYVVLALASLMTCIAGVTAARRNQRRYPGIWLNTIVSVWVSAWLVTAFALLVVLRDIDRWYQPQYAIPLLGMVLGNTLNGITVGLNTFTESLATRRDQVESQLALGATRWEASRGPVRQAVRTGMIPIINSMMIVGIVSLPGMMTGQLVSGMSPLEAVKYQIVIMFLIASATALGTVGAVVLSFLRLTSPDHQFLFQRLSARDKDGTS